MKNRWKEVCERWVRRLGNYTGSVYLLTPREARGRVSLGDALGLTGIAMDTDFRDILRQRGKWQGPGFAAVVALDRIETTKALLATVLHEFCHHAEYEAIRSLLAQHVGPEKVSAAFDTPRDGEIAATSEEREIVRQHGPAFQRLALHLERRAAQAGLFVDIGVARHYGLPSFELRRALGAEPDQLAGLPLTQVAALEPPETFVEFSRAAYDRAKQQLQKG